MATPPGYNVVALISGGKDSFFSLLHCLANGHKLVALANLYPPASSASEELDSYMYQTVGHRLIPLYEEALGVPLYRGRILGGKGVGGREYVRHKQSDGDESEAISGIVAEDDDETEDLIPLLRKVMEAHPEINAVCTGAILSTYQRTRIENVALRLRLTPLAFLWQYPLLPPYEQAGLLSDMCAVGQDSRIVKVASAGLAEDKFLWRNVADLRTVASMKNAMRRFAENGDGAVLGEGGEYETLTLDGPGVLWKGRVEVGDGGYVVDGGAGEGRVVMKEGEGGGLESLRIPPVWDDEFAAILEALGLDGEKEDEDDTKRGSLSTSHALPTDQTFAQLPTNTISLTNNGSIFTYTNMTAPSSSATPSTPQTQLSAIFTRLDAALSQHNLHRSNITHCTLLLRSMSDFATANQTYAAYFDFTNPPARATVAVGDLLPPSQSVMLSVIAHRLDTNAGEKRNGLHVQSQSYWAPANIGPYSQAISVPISSRHSQKPTNPSPSSPSYVSPDNGEEDEEPQTTTPDIAGNEVHIAGQIPLLPASMRLLSTTTPAFAPSALLSLQHLWRIARAMHVTWWASGVALIPYSADRAAQARRVRCIQRAWALVHAAPSSSVDGEEGDGDGDEDGGVDVWDQRNFGPVFEEKTARARIPAPGVGGAAPPGRRVRPSCYVAEVACLPRDAEIEWCCVGVTASASGIIVGTPSSSSSDSSVTIRGGSSGGKEEQRGAYFAAEFRGSTSFVGDSCAWATLYVASPLVARAGYGGGGVQYVPCFAVWGDAGEEVDGVVVGREL